MFLPKIRLKNQTCLLQLSRNEFVNLVHIFCCCRFLLCLSFVLLLFIVDSRWLHCSSCIVAMLLQPRTGKWMDWYHSVWFFRALKSICLCVSAFFLLSTHSISNVVCQMLEIGFRFGDVGILYLPVHYLYMSETVVWIRHENKRIYWRTPLFILFVLIFCPTKL